MIVRFVFRSSYHCILGYYGHRFRQRKRPCRSVDQGNEVPIGKALKQGTAEIWLEGKKLRGGYALVHSKMRGDAKNWLLVKMRDAEADARRNPVSTEPKSVLSGRTLKQVQKAAGGSSAAQK